MTSRAYYAELTISDKIEQIQSEASEGFLK